MAVNTTNVDVALLHPAVARSIGAGTATMQMPTRARYGTLLNNQCWHRKPNTPQLQNAHELDRTAVREVVCALCNTRQPIATHCASCHVAFGEYACLLCSFFDDDTTKKQFHCDACGICRVGGAENFFHCVTCGCCYHINLRVCYCCCFLIVCQYNTVQLRG